MKTLVAVKCKDGWMVKITDTTEVRTEEEIRKMIRQNGLKVNSLVSTKEKIYAE